jgi:hypothetical protein
MDYGAKHNRLCHTLLWVHLFCVSEGHIESVTNSMPCHEIRRLAIHPASVAATLSLLGGPGHRCCMSDHHLHRLHNHEGMFSICPVTAVLQLRQLHQQTWYSQLTI